MTIHWESLFAVFGVSMGATVAVVVLVTLALRALPAQVPGAPARRPEPGLMVAVACLSATAAIVLFGLWIMIAR